MGVILHETTEICLLTLSKISDSLSVEEFSKLISQHLKTNPTLIINHDNTDADISKILLKLSQEDILKFEIFENSETCSIVPRFGLKLTHCDGLIVFNTYWQMNNNINTSKLVLGLISPIFLIGENNKLFFKSNFVGDTTSKAYLEIKEYVENVSIYPVNSKVQVTNSIADAYRAFIWSKSIDKCKEFSNKIIANYQERLEENKKPKIK